MTKKFILVPLLISGCCLFIYSSVWHAKDYKGRILNEAGSPVPGAVVGMGWVIRQYNAYPMFYQEVVTDENGQFHFPGWVKLSPSAFGRLTNSPTMYVLKSAYVPLRMVSHEERQAWDATPTFPETIYINHFKDSKAEGRKLLEFFVADMCSELKLFGGSTLLQRAKNTKIEISKIEYDLPAIYSKNYLRDFSCLL